MFTTEPAHSEAEGAPQPPAAAGPARFARLADPAWIAAVLWARRRLILAMAGLGLGLAILAGLVMAPKYVSTAQLFIDPRDLRVIQNDVSPSAVGSDPTSITGYLESQARVIASDSIKSRVVERLGLDRDPDFGGASGGLLSRLLGAEPGSSPKALLYALAALDRTVAVRRGERTFVIDISATARDPDKAAGIANALAETYLEDQAAVRAEAAQRATAALTGRLEEMRNRLRIAEEKAEKYKEAHNIVGLGGRSLGEDQLALNSAQLVAARTRATEARAKYEQIAATRASGIEAGAMPEAIASNTMTALRAQLGAALAREADLVSSLGARHPALAAAQAQVRDARRQIAEELSRIARAAKAEYDRAVEAERGLARRVEELTAGQYAAGRASVQLRELEREVESSRAVYDAFLRRARETGELGGIDTTNARIISPAMPPLEKSGLSRRTLALIGAVGGGGAGALLALALALFAAPPAPEGAPAPARKPFWRRAPRPGPVEAKEDGPPSPAAPQQPPSPPASAPAAALGPSGWRRLMAIQGGRAEPLRRSVPATIPAPEPVPLPKLGTLPAVRHRRWRREAAELRSVFQGQAHLVDVIDKPKAGFAAAVAGIRRALAEAAGGDERRRILVLALEPQAGATTLALNLALDAALAGLPALLVDAGGGARGLTAVFAAGAPIGFGDVIAGQAPLARARLTDEGTGLTFLPRSGALPSAETGSFRTGPFAAAHRFAPMIVDGGSLPVAGLIARFAEAVDDIVLVTRQDSLAKAEGGRWLEELGPHAAKLRGLVVNAA
ncbi:exopolysaccharide transport family protein [Bosea sp. (in: a-proteobacteria)]|uniref:exopolysaccharide transport family protein n=1 Tax=Bosea sp. (in: a-proteobacteria) TaxID=1871050 RepID=UPI002637E5EE|nr:exopolysaccharide transport family protein [Bosea sp. (in: a-proteobacteria)]MCO5090459.1 exopolysaccharide transport family protein [Bosea sp. (in: a-proteobacteria)]